jgi:hypothetical protein
MGGIRKAPNQGWAFLHVPIPSALTFFLFPAYSNVPTNQNTNKLELLDKVFQLCVINRHVEHFVENLREAMKTRNACGAIMHR